MENMVNDGFWKARRVLITGHTGFKGAWLSLWLQLLGADVVGYSLPAPPRRDQLLQPVPVRLDRVGSAAATDGQATALVGSRMVKHPAFSLRYAMSCRLR